MGTLIVEASFRSGSLVTARLTHEQEKPVFCVPGDIGKSGSLGTNKLIKDYGILATGIEDIFEKLKISYNEKKKEEQKREKKRVQEQKNNILYTNKNQFKCHNKEVNNKDNTFEVEQKRESITIKKEYEPVYKILKEESMSINEICLKSGLGINKVNQILTMLELEGLIRAEAGNRFMLLYMQRKKTIHQLTVQI